MSDSRPDPMLPYLDVYRRVPDWAGRAADARHRRTDGETEEADPRRMCVDLLKRALTGMTQGELRTATARHSDGGVDIGTLAGPLRERREYGADWPVDAQTMIGLDRIENIQACLESIIRDGIPGDLIETGVWRGGATIFMRGMLKAFGVTNRSVWVADSFEGLPEPDPAVSADEDDWFHRIDYLAVSLEQVQANFARYRLLDDQVRFLKGIAKTVQSMLPESGNVMVILDSVHTRDHVLAELRAYAPLVPRNGFVIVEDTNVNGHPVLPLWGPGPMEAVDDFGAEDSGLIVDAAREKFWLTSNPRGFLRRVA